MNKRFIYSTITMILLTAIPVSLASTLKFPKDHGLHAKVNIEWWYFVGHLFTQDQRPFGFELTFFRISAPPQLISSDSAWKTKAIYTSHFAITDDVNKRFYYQEKTNRTSFNHAGASKDRLSVWNGNWRAEMDNNVIKLNALAKDFSISLNLISTKPVLIHGKKGFFKKGPRANEGSYYYSFTRLAGDGELNVDDQKYKIVSASAWMDHEMVIKKDGFTWDWFAIQLNNHEEIIIYLLKSKNKNKLNPYSFATIYPASGNAIKLKPADFQLKQLATWKSPSSKTIYPSHWELTIPKYHYHLEINPTIKKQELITLNTTYWEGRATVTGAKEGIAIAGNAYVELAGYHDCNNDASCAENQDSTKKLTSDSIN